MMLERKVSQHPPNKQTGAVVAAQLLQQVPGPSLALGILAGGFRRQRRKCLAQSAGGARIRSDFAGESLRRPSEMCQNLHCILCLLLFE
jgi:hypothetical protein